MIQTRVIGIVGLGRVGSAAAYAIFNGGIARRLALVGRNHEHEKVQGEALDLMHAQALVSTTEVKACSFSDLSDCQLIVLTAGRDSQSGNSRQDGLRANAEIYKDIVAKLDQYAPDAVLLVVANPVDCITYLVQRFSKRDEGLVLGTGTLLDTARFKALLGEYFEVDPKSIYAFILGEHGESAVPIWSHVTIGGQRIKRGKLLGKQFGVKNQRRLFEEVKRAGNQVRDAKGYTDKAIGIVIAYLAEVILSDQRTILPVSTTLNGEYDGEYGIRDVALSVPCVIGAKGVVTKLLPNNLTPAELSGIRKSASIIRALLDSLDHEENKRS